jgi:hypothetical protein
VIAAGAVVTKNVHPVHNRRRGSGDTDRRASSGPPLPTRSHSRTLLRLAAIRRSRCLGLDRPEPTPQPGALRLQTPPAGSR